MIGDYAQPIDWDEEHDLRTWYAVQTGRETWTISPRPDQPGWNTDCGILGYGLPERVAKEIVARLNRTLPEAE